MTSSIGTVLVELVDERSAQEEKWGEQNHPDGTEAFFTSFAEHYRNQADKRADEDLLTWKDILLEEVWEALAESDPVRLREELIQVAAVAVAWVEAIDRRAQP